MFAPQTMDLYHIETDRKGGYIEFAVRQIYRAEPSEAYRQIASVDTDAVLAKKRGRGASTTLRPFPVGRYHLLLNLKLSFRVQPNRTDIFVCVKLSKLAEHLFFIILN